MIYVAITSCSNCYWNIWYNLYQLCSTIFLMHCKKVAENMSSLKNHEWMLKKIKCPNENENWVIEKWKSSKLTHIDVPNLLQSMLINLYRWIKTLRGYTQKCIIYQP